MDIQRKTDRSFAGESELAQEVLIPGCFEVTFFKARRVKTLTKSFKGNEEYLTFRCSTGT